MKTQWAVVFLLIFLLVASALMVVDSKHQSRKLFQQLNGAERTNDALQIEWGQLQLEQQTLATHGKIEAKAASALQMKVPQGRETIMVVQ